MRGYAVPLLGLSILTGCFGTNSDAPEFREIHFEVGEGGFVEGPFDGEASQCLAGQTCMVRLGPGESATVTAIPDVDDSEITWGGDCEGTSRALTVSYDGAGSSSCTVEFDAPPSMTGSTGDTSSDTADDGVTDSDTDPMDDDTTTGGDTEPGEIVDVAFEFFVDGGVLDVPDVVEVEVDGATCSNGEGKGCSVQAESGMRPISATLVEGWAFVGWVGCAVEPPDEADATIELPPQSVTCRVDVERVAACSDEPFPMDEMALTVSESDQFGVYTEVLAADVGGIPTYTITSFTAVRVETNTPNVNGDNLLDCEWTFDGNSRTGCQLDAPNPDVFFPDFDPKLITLDLAETVPGEIDPCREGTLDFVLQP